MFLAHDRSQLVWVETFLERFLSIKKWYLLYCFTRNSSVRFIFFLIEIRFYIYQTKHTKQDPNTYKDMTYQLFPSQYKLLFNTYRKVMSSRASSLGNVW